jgi:hypothetical protein
MALIQNDFWGDVFRGSTDGEGSTFIKDFSESKISEFEVSIVGNQKIFWFEVSKDDIFGVKVFKTGGDGSSVESCLIGGKGLDRS